MRKTQTQNKRSQKPRCLHWTNIIFAVSPPLAQLIRGFKRIRLFWNIWQSQIRGSKCHCLWHLYLVGGCPQGSKWDDSWVGMVGHLCTGPGLPTGQRTNTTNRDRNGFRTFINQALLLPISCCLKTFRTKQSSTDNPPDHLWGLVMDSWGVY